MPREASWTAAALRRTSRSFGRMRSGKSGFFPSYQVELSENRQLIHKPLVFSQILPVVCQSTEVVC
jgi:hypothetical protein